MDEYENSDGLSQQHYMIAGAAAGILEHCTMYPVDVVRTRMQSIKPQLVNKTFWSSVGQLITKDKLKTFRGMSVVIVGAGPAHALYFSCYENLKQSLLPAENPHSQVLSSSYRQTHRVVIHGLAGCAATILHDAVMNPVEVVKQRMQMSNSPFEGSIACIKHIIQHEGYKAFYRSYFTQLAMNLPYSALHFVTYEYMQDITNRTRDYNPCAHIISGGVAGGVASALTTPLDVCKTLLNTQEKLALTAINKDRIIGLSSAVRIIYKCCGFRGYFQGLQARVVVAIPSTAISWLVYEFFKNRYKQS